MQKNKSGRFYKKAWITEEYMDDRPLTLFIYGDNMRRAGSGPYSGQAGVMRNKPNSIGIPTKWAPSMSLTAMFTDGDMKKPEVKEAIEGGFKIVEQHLLSGNDVCISAKSIGTGRAELAKRAPKIFKYITDYIKYFETEYP